MSSEKKFKTDLFSGILEIDNGHSIFTFTKGSPHANVMPLGEIPSLYSAIIGGKQAYRHPWESEFTYDKVLKPTNFSLKNTSALLFQCIVVLLKEESGFCIKTWKENVHLTLPKLTNYATKPRVTQATSGALRSLVALGYLTIDEDKGTGKLTKDISEAESYGVFSACRDWTYKGEQQKVGHYKAYETSDKPIPNAFPKEEPAHTYDHSDSPEEQPNVSILSKSRVIENSVVTLKDILNCSAGKIQLFGVNGKVMFAIEPSEITIEDGVLFASVNAGEKEHKQISVERIFKDPMQAMAVAIS